MSIQKLIPHESHRRIVAIQRLMVPLVALLMVVGTPGIVLPQTAATATISGTVTDPTGSIVPGATVELLDTTTNQARKQITSDAGRYLFSSVLPGVYKITVTLPGFRQAVIQPLKVDVAKSYSVNVPLELGEATEVVEVTAGVGVELQTLDAPVGTVIQVEQLLRLPNINRSAISLLTLQPMVQPQRGVGVLGGGQVAGARSDQSTFNLDGADASDVVSGTSGYTSDAVDWSGPTPMIPVPAESVEEFRVGTTNPNATFGHSAGGQVNLVTKRGTNALHGSAYWYHQNDKLNANRWEFNRTGIKRPPLKDNRFGFSAGGPIWKDRTFIFGHYEGRRFPQSASIARFVPTSTLKQGLLRFRDGAGNIVSYNIKDFDPRGFGISPVMQRFWNLFPDGNDPSVGDGLNTVGFRAPANASYKSDFAVMRLDHNFTSNWRFDGTFRYSRSQVFDVSQLDIIGLLPGHTRGQAFPAARTPVQPRYLTSRLTGQITPNVTNEFVFGWTRNWWAYQRTPPFPQLSGTNAALMAALGLLDQGIDVDTQRARSRVWADHVWQYTDNLAWVKGKHNWQFGGTWHRLPVFHERDDKVVGSLTSLVAEPDAGTAVTIPSANRPPTCTGSQTNCLQSGDVTRWNRLFAASLGMIDKAGVLMARDGALNPLPPGTPLRINATYHTVEFYANDIWRVRPSLTLSYGLTYLVQTPPRDKGGKQTLIIDNATGQFITAADYLGARRAAVERGEVYNPVLGYMPIKQSGRKYIYDIDWRALSPRVATAWNPSFEDGILGKLFGKQKTVFRGGYARIYDRVNGVSIVMIPILGVGFAQTLSCIGPRADGTCAGPGSDPSNAWRIGVDGSSVPLPSISSARAPVVPAGTAATPFSETLSFSIDPKLRVGYSHNIDFTIQREMPGNTLIEFGYAGRLGRRLTQSVQLSSVPYFTKDSASGQTFAQAFDAVAQQLRSGVAPGAVTPQPWFENQLRGASLCASNPSCTVALAAGQSAQFRDGLLNTLFNVINRQRPGGPITNMQVLDLWVRTSDGRSNYHSFFVSLRKRMSMGFAFDLNYTLSKSLDQYGLNQEFIGVNSSAYDLDIDYGPTLWDRRHVFNANWLYELPFGRGRHWSSGTALDKLIGGWYIGGIFTANSGLPLTVGQHPQVFGGDPINFAVTAGAIPIRGLNFGNSVRRGVAGSGGVGTTGDPTRRGSGLNLYANPEEVYKSFRRVLISQDTRHGRGVLRGLPRWNADFSIGKRTAITERVRTTFSFDLINAFNHVEFDDPGLSLLNPAPFGVLTSQFAGPRAIQFGLRIEF